MRKLIKLAVFTTLLFISTQANSKPSWNQWVNELRAEAISKGISPETFDRAFQGVRPMRRVLSYDRKQPEKRLTYSKYQKTRASKYRIALGKKKYRKNKQLFIEIGHHYNVDPCYIVSLWGMESSYGHFLGKFPVIRSLATLAYDGRRGAFFRKELFLALKILQEGHVPFHKFKGEWAGASGHPQFLPSSWYRFAVDYNQDGRKDIWTTQADAFASIANYLAGNGWKNDQVWGYEVKLPSNFDQGLVGKENKKTLSEWARMGVRQRNGKALPNDTTISGAVIQPYGGPSLLVLKNFNVIMKYNRSTYYAGSITYMADKICGRR